MNHISEPEVESKDMSDFVRVMQAAALPASASATAWQQGPKQCGRLNLDKGHKKNGLGQLVLTLVKLLHEVLERQAIRKVDTGSLSDSEIEDIGVTLMRQTEEIERLRIEFGLEDDDLNLDLGPLGKLL